MFSSTIATLALLAVASLNGSPAPYGRRDPQFSVDLPNRLPVNGNFPGAFSIGQGANGNSVVTFGNGTTGGRTFPLSLFNFGQGRNRFGGSSNTSASPFNFFNFKRDDEELVARDPAFSFNFTNRLPVTGRLPFGIDISQGADGNSIATFGNSSTDGRFFPFNLLPFNLKREEEELVARDPAFSFNFTNRLPVSGRLPFGISLSQGADGNSIATFGNSSTGALPFPFNRLPFNFKRDEEIEARDEIEKRDPAFSFDFSNRLPVTGDLPFGINIAQGDDGNSIATFGNATTGTQSFPFNFKRVSSE